MMKKLAILLLAVVLVSCNARKKEIERLQAKNDSLAQLTQLKDASLFDFIASFNKIQSNLDSIKALENIISINTASGEIKGSAGDQVNEDIKLIYDLLVKNKKLVASLRKKLRNSDVKVAELEKMVTYLNAQIEEKDQQINTLKGELAKMNVEVENLSSRVTELEDETAVQSEEIQTQKQEIETKTGMLNTAYYAIGTKKELIDNNVITKEGGIIGIGSSKTLKENFNKDYFTRVDITKLKFIPLGARKARIITKHTADSYRISGVKKADTLFITNYSDFWSVSKYLVIEVE
mgnify:CR=1 FL=1